MFSRFALILAFSMGFAGAQVPISDNAAGQTLQRWLDAYNSGERVRVEAFAQRFGGKVKAEETMNFRARTGRLELISIDKIDRTHVEFRVKQIASSRTATGELEVTDAVPAQVVKLNFIGLQDLTLGVVR